MGPKAGLRRAIFCQALSLGALRHMSTPFTPRRALIDSERCFFRLATWSRCNVDM